MLSRVLINEPPLLVLPSLATEIGLNEAIILQQLHYWLVNKSNKNHHEGRIWVRNTYEQWGTQFPFWGKNTIVRTIDNLHEKNLITSYTAQSGFRNQKFYTIDYEVLNAIAGLLNSVCAINVGCSEIDRDPENSEIDLPKLGKPLKKYAYKSNNDYLRRCSETNAGTGLREHSEHLHIEPLAHPKNAGLPNLGRSTSENAQSQTSNADNSLICKRQPTPVEVSGLAVGENGQMARVDSGVLSADSEISGSPTTQDGGIDLPISGRPSTQNGYAELPNLGKSYTEAENLFNNINLPPLTPPSLKSAHEEEDDLPLKMIQVWNRLVQEKIKDSPRKELVLTEGRRRALEVIFSGILDGDFAEWERYCSRIAGIRFLLGENDSGFRVNLEWALNVSNALKVLEGQIYDKPGVKAVKVEKVSGEFNQDIDDLFKAHNYPADWLEIYRGFARLKGGACFDAWLKPCVPLAVTDGQAVLFAPTRFHRDHMSANYLCDLKLIARECWKNETDIKIEVKA